jgi:hypothetical protein
MGKRKTPLQSVRLFCLWCCGDSQLEVRECPTTDCVLWQYRLGKGNLKLKTIRLKCLECDGEGWLGVKKCEEDTCPLWVYRFGKRPYNAKSGRLKSKPLLPPQFQRKVALTCSTPLQNANKTILGVVTTPTLSPNENPEG